MKQALFWATAEGATKYGNNPMRPVYTAVYKSSGRGTCYRPHKRTSRRAVTKDPSGIVCHTGRIRSGQTMGRRVSKSRVPTQNMGTWERSRTDVLTYQRLRTWERGNVHILTYQHTKLFHRSQDVYLRTLCLYIK